MQLDQPTKSALVQIAKELDLAGVPFLLGGSAMLRLSGFDIPVGDLDLVVQESALETVRHILGTSFEPPSRAPWCSAWFLQAEKQVGGQSVGIDVIGGLCMEIDGRSVEFPFLDDGVVDMEGVAVPLASVRQWYHLYRMHNPEKAATIAGRLSEAEIMTGAVELGIDDIFSPTLIVRIGNDLPTTGIEQDMSSDVQSSIIEVASPADQVFDEPGTETLDMDLLRETLEYIRPALQADGGDLILLGTQGGNVTLQLVGACGGCPLSTMTLTSGIERIVQDRVPGVTGVSAV